MMENEFERRLKAVDKSLLTAFVRHALGNETIELLDWQFQAIRGGFAQETVGGQGVYRLNGRAQAQNDTLFWSLILKVLGASPGIGSDNTVDWNYWKREVLAYQSGLLDHLPGNFCAPRCFGVIEYPGDEFWIWLEDIAEEVGSEWPLEHYGVVGRHLGQFNGAYLVGGSVPEKPWFTRGRVRNWLELGEHVLQDLGSLAQHPLARRWLTEESLERIQRLWVEREKFLEALDRLPRSLCHHDAFRRNLLARRDSKGNEQTVAIDWSLIGSGAIGEEIATLVTVTLQFLDVDMANASRLEALVFEGYLAGLRDASWQGDAQMVRFGFAAAAALFMGVGSVGLWLPYILDDGGVGTEQVLGHPIDRILEQFAGLQEYSLDLGDEARALMDILA